jgi:hypothetical protein
MEENTGDHNIAATKLRDTTGPKPELTADTNHADSKMLKTDRTTDEDHIVSAKSTKKSSLQTEIVNRANPDVWRTIDKPIKNQHSTISLNCKFIDRILETFFSKFFANKHQYLKAQYQQKSLFHEVLFRLDAHMIVFLTMLEKLAQNDFLSDDAQATYRKLKHTLNLAAIQVPNYLAPLVQLIQDYNPDDPNLNETVYLVMYDAFTTHPARQVNQHLLNGESKFVTSDIHGMMAQIHRLRVTPAAQPNGDYRAAWNHTDSTAAAAQFTLNGQVDDRRGKLNPLIPGQNFVYRATNFGDPAEFAYNNQPAWQRHQDHLIQWLDQFNFPPLKHNDLNTMSRFYYLDANTDWVRFLNAELNSVYFTNDASASADSLCNFTGNFLSWDIDYSNSKYNAILNDSLVTLNHDQETQVNNLIDLSNLTGFIDAIYNPAHPEPIIELIPSFAKVTCPTVIFIRNYAQSITDRYSHIRIDERHQVPYPDYVLLRELIPALPDVNHAMIEYQVAADIRRHKPTKYWDNQRYVTYETTENLDALRTLETFQHIMPPIGSNYHRLTTSTRTGSFYNREHMPVRFNSTADNEYARYVSAVKPYFSQSRP